MAETTSTNFNGGAVAPGSGGLVLSFVDKVKSVPYADFDGNIEFSGSIENFSGYCEISINPTSSDFAHINVYTRATGSDTWVQSCSLTSPYPNAQSHIIVPIAFKGICEVKVSLYSGSINPLSNIIGYLKGFEFKE